MATNSNSKERGSNFGGESHGVRVEYDDGTFGFIQGVFQADPDDPDKAPSLVGYEYGTGTKYAHPIYSQQLDKLIDLTKQMLEQQKIQTLILNQLIRSPLSAADLEDYTTSNKKEG